MDPAQGEQAAAPSPVPIEKGEDPGVLVIASTLARNGPLGGLLKLENQAQMGRRVAQLGAAIVVMKNRPTGGKENPGAGARASASRVEQLLQS